VRSKDGVPARAAKAQSPDVPGAGRTELILTLQGPDMGPPLRISTIEALLINRRHKNRAGSVSRMPIGRHNLLQLPAVFQNAPRFQQKQEPGCVRAIAFRK
jgi:hypothetical protein